MLFSPRSVLTLNCRYTDFRIKYCVEVTIKVLLSQRKIFPTNNHAL